MTDHQKIMAVIKSARLDLSDEKRTQADLALAFAMKGIECKREVRLSPEDIPDFMADGMAIEIKLRGARKKHVYRQICRYAKHETVTAVALVTNLTMGLPETIEGKPVYLIALGRAWL